MKRKGENTIPTKLIQRQKSWSLFTLFTFRNINFSKFVIIFKLAYLIKGITFDDNSINDMT